MKQFTILEKRRVLLPEDLEGRMADVLPSLEIYLRGRPFTVVSHRALFLERDVPSWSYLCLQGRMKDTDTRSIHEIEASEVLGTAYESIRMFYQWD